MQDDAMNESVLDVLTVPDGRRGASSLGLAVLGVLFLVPGLLAPIGVLQLVGAVLILAAVVVGVLDIRRSRTTPA